MRAGRRSSAKASPSLAFTLTRSQLGTSRRTDGSEQVTYAGHPLYRFTADTKPGQTNGEGLEEFGGCCDVLSPAGKKIEADS